MPTRFEYFTAWASLPASGRPTFEEFLLRPQPGRGILLDRPRVTTIAPRHPARAPALTATPQERDIARLRRELGLADEKQRQETAASASGFRKWLNEVMARITVNVVVDFAKLGLRQFFEAVFESPAPF